MRARCSCAIACSRWVLPRPVCAVDEERVVGLRRRLGDRERRRVSEAVGRADHERVERVLRVDRRSVRPGVDGRVRPRRRGAWTTSSSRARSPWRRHARADQLGEAALDPLAREVVRHGEDEASSSRLDGGDLAEPVEGPLVQGAAQTSRHALQRLSAVSSWGAPRGFARPSFAGRAAARIAPSRGAAQ